MPAPWEEFQDGSAAVADGPWAEFKDAAPPPAAAPAKPTLAASGLLRNAREMVRAQEISPEAAQREDLLDEAITQPLGKGLETSGKVIYEGGVNAMANTMAEFGPDDPAQQAAAQVSTETAIKSLPPVQRAFVRGGQGLAESIPRVALSMIPGMAPLAFGATSEGLDPKQAALGVILPGVGKYTGAITEAIASKAGVSSDAALVAWNKLGGAAGAAGLIGADQLNEISKLPEDQRKDATIDALGNVGAMFLLGTVGEHEDARAPAERVAAQVRAARPELPNVEDAAILGGTAKREPIIVPMTTGEELGPQLPRRLQKPVVPETAPEPQRALSAVEEVRAKDARTVRQIQELFPKAELSREQARALRNQAFPTEEAAPVQGPPKPFEELQPVGERPPQEKPARVTAMTDEPMGPRLPEGATIADSELTGPDLPPGAVPAAGTLAGPNWPAKLRRPVVPETPAEARETAVETVRRANARTVRQIQELFPKAELSREQARALRNQAFPEEAAPVQGPPKPWEEFQAADGPVPARPERLTSAEQAEEQARLAKELGGEEETETANLPPPPDPTPAAKTPAAPSPTLKKIPEAPKKAETEKIDAAEIPEDLAAEIEKQKTGSGPLSEPEQRELSELRWIKEDRGKLGMLNQARLEHLESRGAGQTVTHSMGGGAARRAAAPAPATPAHAPVDPKRVSALVQDMNRLRAATAPQTMGEPARFVGNVLRNLSAKSANEMLRADEALKTFRADFDRTPLPADWKYDPAQPLPRNLAFIDAYEGGDMRRLSPKERDAAQAFRAQNEEWLDRVHGLGTGALRTFYENYFPHLWDDPAKAKQVFAAILGKRPLEGPKSFLKQRTHQLTRDGLAAGLKPVHDNPVDLWLLKKREVERYILAHEFIQQTKAAGLLKFVHAFQKAPEGYSLINDRAFEVFGPPTVEVKEAFDAGMREATMQLLADLGVPHNRLAKLGGKRWGFAQYREGVPGTEKIATKFGGPPDVIWHELGHVLDNRYPELRVRMKKWALLEPLGKEMNALAALRYEGETPTPAYQRYVHSTPEKMAVILQAYVHAPERMAEVAPTVKKEFEIFLDHHPELSRINDIRPTLRLGTATAEIPVGGLVKMGNYMLPDAAARVVNNYLSPGLNPHLWYRSLREASNLLNGIQLGVSAFHLGFTSLDAATSRLAVGIEDAMRGDIGRAMRTVASVPVSPVTNIWKGAKVRAEVLKPGSQSADIQQIAHALELAGGRVGQDKFWSTEFTRRLKRAFHEARNQDALFEGSDFKTLWNAPFALFEQTLRPIMEFVVPRQKLGVFADMASRELERLGPGADPAVVREAMRKAWDSVDNRMGQIVYDNLFYNRAVKDVALLSFRAYGWQLGKYREGIGAVLDTARAGKAVVTGQRPEFTHRMAYAMALPLMVGFLGSVINYLYTRELPKEARDYFMPRTGETDQNGNAVRLNLPSYMKDVIAYSKHPVTSFGHSLNPMGSVMFDLLENKDFYDVRIRNPDDPLWQQGSDVAKFAGKQFVPFSVSGAMKLRDDAAPVHKQIMPFFGITPVPSRITMTPAQELASELVASHMGDAPITQEQFDRSKIIKDAVRGMKTGQPDKTRGFAEALAAGKLNPDAVQALIDRLKYTPLQFQVFHLSAEDAIHVWRVASPEERQGLQQIMVQKVLNAETVSMEKKQQYLGEVGGG